MVTPDTETTATATYLVTTKNVAYDKYPPHVTNQDAVWLERFETRYLRYARQKELLEYYTGKKLSVYPRPGRTLDYAKLAEHHRIFNRMFGELARKMETFNHSVYGAIVTLRKAHEHMQLVAARNQPQPGDVLDYEAVRRMWYIRKSGR